MAIPTLASGTCIITGTAFVMPVFANVKYIKDKEERPSSDNVDLLGLWTHFNQKENINQPFDYSLVKDEELEDIK